jgi:hypothetical protein
MSGRLQPPYFNRIKKLSSERWDRLEADEDLAAPWRQLFRQVQSPRHVISELLQNADDAGATHVSARIVDGAFVFEHDGLDFNEEQFGSLCRFGNSNKRRLHTIGFRGIGFKSTFSLGDRVVVVSPTLAVEFHAARFTDPVWISGVESTGTTVIAVRFRDEERKRALLASMEQWTRSPASLLFFHSVSSLQIGDIPLAKKIVGQGPVPGSERIALTSDGTTSEVLVIRSGEEPFPEDAIAEIRDERSEPTLDLPPCSVEVVVNAPESGRVFVVLPTAARLDVPFCINGPFVQDPARVGLKDPSGSPTNRWLLRRAGLLAAKALRDWVADKNLMLSERAAAYSLLPPARSSTDDEASAECELHVRTRLAEQIQSSPIALCSSGQLASAAECYCPPTALYRVWSPDLLAQALGHAGAEVLAEEVAPDDRAKLVEWGAASGISEGAALAALDNADVPRPEHWHQLASLWLWVQRTVSHDWSGARRASLRIVPTGGAAVLASASACVRLPADSRGFRPEDWEYLGSMLLAVDPGWTNYLAQNSEALSAQRELLRVLGLDRATPTDELALRAYKKLLGSGEVTFSDLLRFTLIIAKLGAAVPGDFQYATRDNYLRPVSSGLALDVHGRAEAALPEPFAQQHLLHDQYLALLDDADAAPWLASGKSGLQPLPVMQAKESTVYGLTRLRALLRTRGSDAEPTLQRRTEQFVVSDFDFYDEVLENWTTQLVNEPRALAVAVRPLLAGAARHWEGKLVAAVRQQTAYGNNFGIGVNDLAAAWIHRLSELPCLLDTHGAPRLPCELLLRSPQTEPFLELEPFAESEVDQPHNRALLLVLGARDTPTDSGRILDRIRALAACDPADVIQELARRYGQLDSMYLRLSGDQQRELKDVFARETLLLTAAQEWKPSGAVVQSPGDFAPESISVLHPCARGLPVWSRIGVSERPKLEFILQWLSSIPENHRLDAADAKRVRSVLQAYPGAVWNELGRWLSLDGSLAATSSLNYRLSMRTLVSWSGLFQHIKAEVADFRMLSDEAADGGLGPLKELATELRFAVTDVVRALDGIDGSWVRPLALSLRRIRLPDPEVSGRIRECAGRLLRAKWTPVHSMSVTPMLDGVQAGTPFTQECVWAEDNLYIVNAQLARTITSVTSELSRPFDHGEIAEAIRACVGRDPAFIEEYFSSHFELVLEADLDVDSEDGMDTAPNVAANGNAVGPTIEVDLRPLEAATSAMSDSTHEPAPEPPRAHRNEPRRATAASTVDLLASHLGFTRSQGGRYVGRGSSSLERNSLAIWDSYNEAGEHDGRYWFADRDLEDLELPASVWHLLEAEPDLFRLVIHDALELHIYSGTDVLRLRDSGELDVTAASYRLRLRASERRA